jgi:sporulation protein YlmC with PRC-barrel domain
MPRHDWRDDEMMTRERSDWRSRDERGYGREHGFGGRDRDFDRDRGAFFGRDRDEDRGHRRPIGGWGGLMGDEDRSRERDRMRRREEGRRFGPDDLNRGVPMDETERLIASNKVEGTPVFDRHGDKLGTIHNFMVDKRKGQVVYAVLRHGGGFLGLGERYYPLEWDQLTYDTRLEGYHVELVEEDLQNFGSFDSEGRYHRRQMRGERGFERSDRHRDW